MQRNHDTADASEAGTFVEDSRRHVRTTVFKAATVYPVLREASIQISNISRLGIAGKCTLPLSLHQTINLTFDKHQYLAADIRWVHGNRYGVQLANPIAGLPDIEPDGRRSFDGLVPRAPRIVTQLAATLVTTSPVLPGRIRNISQCGMLVEIAGRFREGERLLVKTGDQPALIGCIRWTREGRVGLEFSRDLPDEIVPAKGHSHGRPTDRIVCTPGPAASAEN
jgi:hypothetical protein